MLTGTVDSNLQAKIVLRVQDVSGNLRDFQAVVDTGYNGDLTLARELIQDLNLPLFGFRRATLADGGVVRVAIYSVTLVWDRSLRQVLAAETEGVSLAGMSLLWEHRLILDVVDDGKVTIERLRAPDESIDSN